METQKQVTANPIPQEEKSYFDGGFWGLLGYSLLVGFVTIITLGIAFPWMCCVLQNWKARHTMVCGHRMHFDGKGHQLIGRYLLWSFLSIITFGIYGFWMTIAIRKWITKHTHFMGEKDNNSYFDGGIWGFIGTKIVCGLLLTATLGIGAAWSKKIMTDWETRHTVIDSRRLVFTGTGGSLFGKYILWGFLSLITFGIFGLWIPIKLLKWQYTNTIDNEHTTEELIRRSEYRSLVKTQAADRHTQRVQDEMELVKSGVTDATDQDALFTIAESGNRAAQFAYVTRFGEGKHGEEPFLGFLKASAKQGYPPAMNLYGLSGLAGEEEWDMVTQAARKGQADSAIRVMRDAAQKGLGAQNDVQALPFLEEAVRWFDVLSADGVQMADEDREANQRCVWKIRSIKAKAVTKKTSVGKIIGIVLLVILAIGMLTFLVGGVIAYFRQNTFISGVTGTPWMEALPGESEYDGKGNLSFESDEGESSSSVISSLFGLGGLFGKNDSFGNIPQTDLDAYAESVIDADQWEEVYEEETDSLPEGVVLSDLTYDEFMDALRAKLEGDPNYYVITHAEDGDRGHHYTMTCNHWYWASYFDLYVKEYEGYVTSIELDGPRIYETIDEAINGQEFQFLLKRMYEILGIGPDGETGGVFIKIDPGTNGMQPFVGWDYNHNHTEDRLNTIISANEEAE